MAASDGDRDTAAAPPAAGAASPLASLRRSLEAWAKERQDLVRGTDIGLPTPAEWPALPALGGMRGLWAGLRNREQLRRALQPAPAEAGPLNSAALSSRMLRLMQEASPGYLRHFAAYVDILASLEHLQARDVSTGQEGAGPAPRAGRAAPRRRRGASRSPAGLD